MQLEKIRPDTAVLGPIAIRADNGSIVPNIFCGNAKQIALELALNRATNEDRFENYGINFQRQLRQNFLDIANKHSDRIKIIDGNRSPQQVAAQIIESVETLVK